MAPSHRLRLACVLAHPDDESLGTGGTLAHYSAQDVGTHVITATRGDGGRFRTPDTPHPGREELGRVREKELRAAADVLGVEEVSVLGYPDGALDQADRAEAVGRVVDHLRRIRPQVVITFDPFGAYGHPDHVAVSQIAMTAVVAAADPGFEVGGGGHEPHRVSKLYYIAWPPDIWDAYQRALKKLVSTVDGVERQVNPWPDWSITTRLDATAQWRRVWKAVQCHESQMAIYQELGDLEEDYHRVLWGSQSFYRAFSLVNGGRDRESDLFEGLR